MHCIMCSFLTHLMRESLTNVYVYVCTYKYGLSHVMNSCISGHIHMYTAYSFLQAIIQIIVHALISTIHSASYR